MADSVFEKAGLCVTSFGRDGETWVQFDTVPNYVQMDERGVRQLVTRLQAWLTERDARSASPECTCGPQCRPHGGLHAPVQPGTQCLRCLKPIGVP